jgi:hypothetical protein
MKNQDDGNSFWYNAPSGQYYKCNPSSSIWSEPWQKPGKKSWWSKKPDPENEQFYVPGTIGHPVEWCHQCYQDPIKISSRIAYLPCLRASVPSMAPVLRSMRTSRSRECRDLGLRTSGQSGRPVSGPAGHRPSGQKGTRTAGPEVKQAARPPGLADQ